MLLDFAVVISLIRSAVIACNTLREVVPDKHAVMLNQQYVLGYINPYAAGG